MNWNIYFQTCTALTWRKRLSNFSTILIPFIFLGKNTILALITVSTRRTGSGSSIQRTAGEGRHPGAYPGGGGDPAEQRDRCGVYQDHRCV